MIHQKDCLHLSLDDLGGNHADLIYMDPPFGEGGTYSLSDGTFCYDDGFPSDRSDRFWYTSLIAWMQARSSCSPAFVVWPDEEDSYSWGIWLLRRIYNLRKLLSPTGTFVLHISTVRAHLVRFALDKLFGQSCFRNEVIWRYRRWPSPSRDYQRMHDVLLVYSKNPNKWTFNQLYEPLAESTLKTFKGKKQRADFSTGRRKPSVDPEESKGALLSDVWDIGVVPPSGKERTGYPTQKPEALLERVILSRSNPRDLVLDPFCGSGTTLAVAQRTGRAWVGCDIGEVACKKSRVRLGLHDLPDITP